MNTSEWSIFALGFSLVQFSLVAFFLIMPIIHNLNITVLPCIIFTNSWWALILFYLMCVKSLCCIIIDTILYIHIYRSLFGIIFPQFIWICRLYSLWVFLNCWIQIQSVLFLIQVLKKKKLRRRVRVLDMLYSGQMSSFLSQDLFAFGQNGLGQAQFCTWEWQNRKGLVVFHWPNSGPEFTINQIKPSSLLI